jgi:serine/threonine protein kinase
MHATATAWERKQFESERALLSDISHPNICRLIAFSTDGPYRCLVLELCVGGALDSRLECTAAAGPDDDARGGLAPVPLLWQHRLRIMHDIAAGLSHLHQQVPPVLHRDVKSANCLLDEAGNAKVADFGTVHEGVGEGTVKTHLSTKQVACNACAVRLSGLFMTTVDFCLVGDWHTWLYGKL